MGLWAAPKTRYETIRNQQGGCKGKGQVSGLSTCAHTYTHTKYT